MPKRLPWMRGSEKYQQKSTTKRITLKTHENGIEDREIAVNEEQGMKAQAHPMCCCYHVVPLFKVW